MTTRIVALPTLSGNLVFGKCKKLKTDEISSVFNFKHQVNGDFLRILYKPCHPLPARLAVVISKKTVRHAVSRNYCKRVARELFRTRQFQIGSLELVIQVRKEFESLQFE
ncbi:MAG: ribonuclease P protein component, partial [Nitrospirae bacterium]